MLFRSRYPEELCRAICRGYVKYQKSLEYNLMIVGEVKERKSGGANPDPEDLHDKDEERWMKTEMKDRPRNLPLIMTT